MGLSENVHRKNERLMHVNAQVTAVTTMVEFTGNCINYIIFLVLSGHVNFISYALYMLLYFVVLSYAFLMNTRYNKNRIIEYGWINVLRNISGRNGRNEVLPHKHVTPSSKVNQNTSKLKEGEGKIESSGASIVSSNQILTTQENIQFSKEVEYRHCCKIKQPEIFIISFDVATTSLNYENGQASVPNSLKGGIVPNSQIYGPSLSNKSKNVGSRSSSIDETCQQNSEPSISRNRSTILDDLISSLHNEVVYVRNVLRLVGLEKAYQNHQDIAILGDDNADYTNIELPHFVGSTEQKHEMRSTMINKLLECKTDDETYNEHFEYFIEMEESLLENGC